MTHTPGPWKWQGEDYRGDWGWQILTGPNGEGILISCDEDGPSKHIKVGMPVDSSLCVTGMMAHGKEHVKGVHVFRKDNAKLIFAAPELLKALEAILIEARGCENFQDGAGKETCGYGLIRATAINAIEQAKKVKNP